MRTPRSFSIRSSSCRRRSSGNIASENSLQELGAEQLATSDAERAADFETQWIAVNPPKIACTLKSPSTLVPFRVSSQGVSQSCSQTAFLFYTSKCACFFFSERLLLCYISHYKRETGSLVADAVTHTTGTTARAPGTAARARSAHAHRPGLSAPARRPAARSRARGKRKQTKKM